MSGESRMSGAFARRGVVTRINPCNGRAIIRLPHGQLVAVDTQRDLAPRDELLGDFTQPGGVIVRNASRNADCLVFIQNLNCAPDWAEAFFKGGGCG
jgi:hypothetical protein